MALNRDLITEEEQRDLDDLGIAKNAREEKIRARNEKMKTDAAYNEKMARLYREVVLKEEKKDNFVPLSTIAPPAPANGNGNGNGAGKHVEEVGETVAGD